MWGDLETDLWMQWGKEKVGWIKRVTWKHMYSVQFSVQSLSRVQLFATPWTAAHKASLSITNCRSLLKLMSIESMMSSSISSSVVPFSLLQSFPASGSFPMSWLFESGGHNIRASASASVLPMNIQNWFPLGLTGLISLQSKGLSGVLSRTIVQKHQFFGTGDWNLSGSRGNCLGYLIKS